MSEATRLLSAEEKRSPLRVRIPATSHANDAASTSVKPDAEDATPRERSRVRYTVSLTVITLMVVLCLMYLKAGSRAAQPSFSSSEASSAPDKPVPITGTSAQNIEAMNFGTLQSAGQSTSSLAVLPTSQSVTSANSSKAVVVAQHREDIAWLKQLAPEVQLFVYQAENDTAERPVRVNQGETAVYLQYIVEEYNNLPDHVVFVHAHQIAQHMPDKLDILQNLRWDAFGYANLRYVNITYDLWGKWTGDWLCPHNPIGPAPSEEILWDELRVNQSKLFADVWGELFVKPLGPLPEYVHAPCCAEFLASKERIRSRPLSFYQTCLAWVEEASSDRYWAGRIFEYVWHMIFGEPAMYYAPGKCELLYC